MTTYSSTRVAAGTPAKGLRVGLVCDQADYSVGAGESLVSGDVIQMLNIPKNAFVVYCALSGGSGDAIIALGDGVDTDRYLNGASMGSAAPTVRVGPQYGQSTKYIYSTDDTIDVLVEGVSVATITGGFRLICVYSMDTV